MIPDTLQPTMVQPAGSRLAARADLSETDALSQGRTVSGIISISSMLREERRWSPWPNLSLSKTDEPSPAMYAAQLRLQRMTARQDDIVEKVRSAEERAALCEYKMAMLALQQCAPGCLVYGWVEARVARAARALQGMTIFPGSGTLYTRIY